MRYVRILHTDNAVSALLRFGQVVGPDKRQANDSQHVRPERVRGDAVSHRHDDDALHAIYTWQTALSGIVN